MRIRINDGRLRYWQHSAGTAVSRSLGTIFLGGYEYYSGNKAQGISQSSIERRLSTALRQY